MKFDRMPRHERIRIEGRKAVAFRSRQARELEKYPLLAGEIEESLPSIEEAEMRRNEIAGQSEKRMRDLVASHWRKGRRAFFSSDEATKEAIRIMWSSWAGPLRASYFCYVVDVCTGEHERRASESMALHREIRAKVRKAMGIQQSIDLEVA